MEIWRKFSFGQATYEVSSLGRVRTTKGRIRKTRFNRGYESLQLWSRGRKKTFLVHTLVAHCFIGPRPEGYQTNHKDAVKANNNVENLEYVTGEQNREHAKSLGLYPVGDAHANSKLTPAIAESIRECATWGLPQRKIAELFSVSQRLVWNVLNGGEYRRDCH
jgi:hypothetical protein